MRVNRQIRVPKVRVITEDGDQLGVLSTYDALQKAKDMGLDLVEVSPNADPPVCKIIDHGKYQYQKSKKEKTQKKGSVAGKLKEVKVKPNIDTHDLNVKINRARGFLEKGNKVKFTCMFRGREIVFVDNGKMVLDKISEALSDVSSRDTMPKMLGRTLHMILSPKKT